MDQDPVSVLIDRVAEAVVRKIDEQQKIDAIARAVLDRLAESASHPDPSVSTSPKLPASTPSKPSRPGGRRVAISTKTRTGKAKSPSPATKKSPVKSAATSKPKARRTR